MTIGSATRHGPNLPYTLVAGVTPCGPAWLVAAAKLQGTIFAPEEPQLIRPFSEVLDQRPSYAVIALNAPVGYLDQASLGGRTCDREARALLGPKRGSSIQSAPVRSATDELEFKDEHLDAISMTLLPRYREVAAEMAPFRQRTVYEVHSDVTFFELNDGQPMQFPKQSEKGLHERRELLETEISRRGKDPLGRDCPVPQRHTSSTLPPLCGRPGASSTVRPSASPGTRSGTSWACGWRSSANPLDTARPRTGS